MTDPVIYKAARILTLEKDKPFASHVLIEDGLILAVGSLAEVEAHPKSQTARRDDRFADKVLTPGFIEGHAHLDGGTVWKAAYVGPYDRTDPDGRIWPAARSIEAVVERLKAHAAEAEGGVSGWGFDPLLIGQSLDRHHLDAVSQEHPVTVFHASGHIIVANSAALKLAKLFPAKAPHPGLPTDESGLPVGELRGSELMGLAITSIPSLQGFWNFDGRGAKPFSRTCVRVGVTTSADLANALPEKGVEALLATTAAPDFPIRIVPALIDNASPPEAVIEKALKLAARSSDRLRLGAIKLVLDGSIQGFTARLLAGSYYSGAPNGLWYLPPERLAAVYDLALKNGVQIHTHTNGDQATELALETLERLLAASPKRDHGFVLQHAQLAHPDQLRRAAKIGLNINLFPNHIYYWGEVHARHTVGPERARTLNPCRSALEAGVTLAIHSDDPVTPIAPLFTAWCAVNRLTSEGHILGPDERISVEEALYAITLGAAKTLRLDAEIGSIKPGKKADFAVLDQDPLSVAPEALRDIPVWGTLSGGRIFEAASA